MMKYSGHCRRRMGFNAIELVVVVLLVFILLGMVLVALKIQRDSDRILVSPSNNLKQMTLAANNFNAAFKKLPPAFERFGKITFPASVHVHLMPFLEQDSLYQEILKTKGQVGTSNIVHVFLGEGHFRRATNDAAGVQEFAANLRVFSDKGVETPFDANMAPLGPLEPGTASIPRTFEEDGTSNTIVFATKFGQCANGGSHYAANPISPFAAFFGQNAAKVSGHPSDPTAAFQTQPNETQCLTSPLMAQSRNEYGLSVAMADGSIRLINRAVSPRTWNQLVQPNDGMKVEDDWL